MIWRCKQICQRRRYVNLQTALLYDTMRKLRLQLCIPVGCGCVIAMTTPCTMSQCMHCSAVQTFTQALLMCLFHPVGTHCHPARVITRWPPFCGQQFSLSPVITPTPEFAYSLAAGQPGTGPGVALLPAAQWKVGPGRLSAAALGLCRSAGHMNLQRGNYQYEVLKPQ